MGPCIGRNKTAFNDEEKNSLSTSAATLHLLESRVSFSGTGKLHPNKGKL
jgi:hypothetical protein